MKRIKKFGWPAFVVLTLLSIVNTAWHTGVALVSEPVTYSAEAMAAVAPTTASNGGVIKQMTISNGHVQNVVVGPVLPADIDNTGYLQQGTFGGAGTIPTF